MIYLFFECINHIFWERQQFGSLSSPSPFFGLDAMSLGFWSKPDQHVDCLWSREAGSPYHCEVGDPGQGRDPAKPATPELYLSRSWMITASRTSCRTVNYPDDAYLSPVQVYLTFSDWQNSGVFCCLFFLLAAWLVQRCLCLKRRQ